MERKQIVEFYGISVELLDVMGSDLTIVNAARASFDKRKGEFDDKDAKLLRYLWEHKHTTPFRHPQISISVTAPIFIARQLVKHQVGMSWSEVSRRYVDSTPDIWRNPQWHKRPDANIKQGSGDVVGEEVAAVVDTLVDKVCRDAVEAYERLLFMGVAPEEARIVLPLATQTTWVWTGSLLSFINVYQQRKDGHAQLPAQAFADCLGTILADLFPVTMEIVNGRCA